MANPLLPRVGQPATDAAGHLTQPWAAWAQGITDAVVAPAATAPVDPEPTPATVVSAGQGVEVQPASDGVRVSITPFVSELAAESGAELVGFTQSGTGAVARTVQDKGRESVSVADFGAVGDGVTDDTAALQAAINATGYGKRLMFLDKPYRVTDTLQFSDKRGAHFFGQSRGAFGLYGARIVWAGGTAKPIAQFGFFKESVLEGITFVGANTTTHRATAALLFDKSGYLSHGPAVIRACHFDNTEFGVMLGDQSYDDTYNVSEFTFEHCRFNSRYGLYVAGVATGGQNVNHRLVCCDFGGAFSERGIWLAGGNVFVDKCSWNGSYSSSPYTAFYMAGNVTTTIPITFRDCYAEQIAKFLETEYTATAAEFNRTSRVMVESSFLRCNRPLTGSAYLVECYKDIELELRNVTCQDGDILYSPPANQSALGYSTTAPASNALRFTGANAIAGSVTTSRGGYVQSIDRAHRGDVPFGYMYPSGATVAIVAGVRDLPEYGAWASYDTNATHDLATITGGQVGDRLHLKGHPDQATFRVPNIKHGTGNIFLATGADFLINTATRKVVLQKDVSGNWLETGRVTV